MLAKLPFRKFTKQLFTVLFLIAVGLVFTPHVTAQLPASEIPGGISGGGNVGTHLGQFEVDTQISIMDMLKSKGAEDGFPVTLIVVTNYQQGELNSLADGVRRNNFFPIVRIDGVCEGADAAGIVSRVKAAFGEDVPIEYGNEVNNQEIECADYAAYASEYAQVSGLANVGPSALDYYNTVFQASDFNSAVGGPLSGDVFFANAYGCVGEDLGSCDVASTNTHVQGYEPVTGRPLYLTEFGIVPSVPEGVDFAEHYAGSGEYLQKTIDFIESRASSVPAEKITPLIRNVCDDDGFWLLYLHGEIYTQSGTQIDPETCGPPDVERAPFYIYPIEALKKVFDKQTGNINLPAQAIAPEITDELIDQGYEVLCTAPQAGSNASLNFEEYQMLVDPELDGLPVNTVNFTKEVDYTGLEYPLFRATQQAQSVNDSIEAHFGYLDTTEPLDPLQPGEDPREKFLETGWETKSAALYKLLTVQQQCEHQKKMLETINIMCNKLDAPETCALYQDIPDSEYTTETLYPVSQSLSCDPQEREVAMLSSEVTEKQYLALQNTPLYLDKAYRLGFIIVTLENRTSVDIKQEHGWDFLFNRDERPEGVPKDEVRVIAFKLPDIGTNKDKNSDIHYDDPLTITKNILTTKEEQDAELEYYNQKKEIFKESAKIANEGVPNNSALINCAGPACSDPLSRSLINLVNSGVVGAEEEDYQGPVTLDETCQLSESQRQSLFGRFEKSNTIQTPGRLNVSTAGPGTLFQQAFQALTSIFRSPDDAASAPEEFELEGTLRIDPKRYEADDGPDSNMNTYLIYPVGYELEQVTQTLAGLIKDAEDVRELPNNPDYDPYFLVNGLEQDYETDLIKHPYFLAPGQGSCPPGIEACEKAVNYTSTHYLNDFDYDNRIDSIPFEPKIKGGILGNMMKEIQLTLREVGSSSWHYLNSCKTTEEFLLGNCSDTATIDAITLDGIRGGTCSELYGSSGTNPVMTIFDQETTFNMIIDEANKAVSSGKIAASEKNQFAQTLWGILEIENSPYLARMRTISSGETVEISCSKTINSCGGVGPLQITQGACVTESCPYYNLSDFRNLDRPDHLCDFDQSLSWTAENLLENYDGSIENLEARYAAMAGNHVGLGSCNTPATSQAVASCGNYCDCAATGFADRFEAMLEDYGG